jgi:hypothetical protein
MIFRARRPYLRMDGDMRCTLFGFCSRRFYAK